MNSKELEPILYIQRRRDNRRITCATITPPITIPHVHARTDHPIETRRPEMTVAGTGYEAVLLDGGDGRLLLAVACCGHLQTGVDGGVVDGW